MWYASSFDKSNNLWQPDFLPAKDSICIGTKNHPRRPMCTFIKKGFYSDMISIDNTHKYRNDDDNGIDGYRSRGSHGLI